jgi:flavin-dependent dehydrogenase
LSDLPHHDVVVVGAGPAGSVLAARLAAAGIDTLIVEKTRLEHDCVGEFLSPQARIAVDRLGLLEDAWQSQHAEINEFISCWGFAHSVLRNYIYDPRGHGLILDRLQFNRALVAAARRSGAKLLTGVTLLNATRLPNGWTMVVRRDAVLERLHCSFIVSAGGRLGHRLRALPTRRRSIDKLVCFVACIKNYAGDGRPAIESYSDGWAYSVGLPSGDLMINLCSESDSNPERRLSNSLHFLLKEIAQCPVARSRLMSADPKCAADVKTFVTDASSACTRPVSGPGWCLVGDSAQCMDPLSSSGISHAIRHSELAAREMPSSAELHSLELSTYGSELDKIYAGYLAERSAIYSAEQRWNTPFWQRRSARGANPTPAGSAPPPRR